MIEKTCGLKVLLVLLGSLIFLLPGCGARGGGDDYPPADVCEGATTTDPCENDVLAHQHDENFLENLLAMQKEAALATFTLDIETWPIYTRIIYSMLLPSGFHMSLETSIEDGVGYIHYMFGFQANETVLDPEYQYWISFGESFTLLIQDGDIWRVVPLVPRIIKTIAMFTSIDEPYQLQITNDLLLHDVFLPGTYRLVTANSITRRPREEGFSSPQSEWLGHGFLWADFLIP